MGLCRTASIVALAAYYSVLVGRIYSLQVQVRCYPEYTQNTIIYERISYLSNILLQQRFSLI